MKIEANFKLADHNAKPHKYKIIDSDTSVDSEDKMRICYTLAEDPAAEDEKEFKRRAIHEELKRLAGGYQYQGQGMNYSLTYNETLNFIIVRSDGGAFRPYVVYFPTFEAALGAIDSIGRGRLMQDYFGVDHETED